MDEFRKKLERKMRINTIMCCILPIVYFTLLYFVGSGNTFSHGMVIGIFVGGMVSAVYSLVRNYVLLHNEEKLKKQYIEETDERNNSIAKETMQTASLISMYVTAFAIMISGFFSEIVSITLWIVLMVDVIITCAVQAYYKKHM